MIFGKPSRSQTLRAARNLSQPRAGQIRLCNSRSCTNSGQVAAAGPLVLSAGLGNASSDMGVDWILLIVRREMKTLSLCPASDELNRIRHDGTRPFRHDD
jgi:hypothetical protein